MINSEFNIFKKIERTLEPRRCACGKRCVFFVKEDDSRVFRYSSCSNCLDMDVATKDGFQVPQLHPLTPALFRSTDPSRLHHKVQEALGWMPTYDKTGLLLHGTTGVGKSRAVWHIINRIWLSGIKRDFSLPIEFVTMRKMEEMIEKSFGEREHSKFIKELSTVELLVIDDLGKEKLTSRMATDLFSIIDERSINQMATIITTNFNGSALVDRFSNADKETGVAIVRRLRDYYEIHGIGSDISQ
jgi:DNA replication protein DnaC